MVEETSPKVPQLITVLHNEHHINEMTEKWLRKSTNRLGKPAIISGVTGPTEKLSAFVDILLQQLAQQQKSYLKD